MKWNPFKKREKSEKEKRQDEDFLNASGAPKMEDMNMLQRFAMKRIMAMSPQEREKLMRKAMTPKNVAKHKDEILASLDAMKKAGQISDDQYRLAKRKLGI